MSWDAFGAIAEAMGTIAVLVTLIYLARQVSQDREERHRSLLAYRQTTVRDFTMERVRNPDLTRALLKGRMNNGDPLPPPFLAVQEAGQLTDEETSMIHNYFLAHFLFRIETLQNLHLMSEQHRVSFEEQLYGNYAGGLEGVWFSAIRGWEQSRSQESPEAPIFQHFDLLKAKYAQ